MKLRWRLGGAFTLVFLGALLWLTGAPLPMAPVFFGMALAEVCRYLLESGRVQSERWKRALSSTAWVMSGVVLSAVLAYFIR